ncbi:hypothetical protein [Chitinophaga qingshengii]|uniref:Uncharacterized protein n=1 Tax=Chitinophaga qingshengii TaxID=1569794 RepID=A0ABR7TRA9_9BACT|nr:hypothetical protein [Chitinophaga qingshengii]MBC9933034.1 hypothetical protein [Chitinophaga qingshengii]
MKAAFYSHTQFLGTIDLKITDESMGVVGGILTPTSEYFALQAIFRKCAGAHNAEIEQLVLNIQLENGCFLHAVGGYSILDAAAFPDEISIEVVGSNFFTFFDAIDNSNRPFVFPPWYPLTIETKLAIEKGLSRETGLFLQDHQFLALAQHGPNDDVLFYVAGNSDCSFAVIRLTRTGRPETDPRYPMIRFYQSFDDFKKGFSFEAR